MILTRTTGIIMGPVTWLLGTIFNALYNLFYGMGVESIALSIIVFTILMRLILFPFNLKTTRSSKIQQFLQPEFNKINKKYKGKKDNESILAQQRETRELQQKYGIKMSTGCITGLLQFPIFIGLYNVISNVPSYVPRIHKIYEPIASAILKSDNAFNLLDTFIKDEKLTRVIFKSADLDSVIDVLFKCNNDLFVKITQVFGSFPEVGKAYAQSKSAIEGINHFFFGINLSENPGFKLSWAMIIPVASFVAQLLSMMVMPSNETGDPQQDAQMKTMKRTMYIMPIFSFLVTVNAPAGLGLYWAASAFIGFLITVFTNFYYSHVDMEKLVEKQLAKAEIQNAKRKASGKKSLMEKFTEAAMGQNPQEEAKQVNQRLSKYSNMNLKNYDNSSSEDEGNSSDSESSTQSNSPRKKGSLADKANAVKRFNESGV
ncbi:MAG: membrane protein insertase YidC [Eubacterium sp.]|nr:membrane protein insertase YidC [Eubacterium sp.]